MSFNTSSAQSDAQQHGASHQQQSGNAYQGVRGWLLLLCISLTVINPLVTLLGTAMSFNSGISFSRLPPGFAFFIAIDTLFGLGFMVFSIYAGIALWMVKPNAVSVAQRYLFALLIYSILFIPLLLVVNLAADFSGRVFTKLLEGSVMSVFRTLIYFLVWNSYLNKSKRVKATYFGIHDDTQFVKLNLNS
ncbi:MAG: DUF2569 family protein [Blastocatellia bacterium]|nr:DUF2569 family protein [Blastocatellia bacterium]